MIADTSAFMYIHCCNLSSLRSQSSRLSYTMLNTWPTKQNFFSAVLQQNNGLILTHYILKLKLSIFVDVDVRSTSQFDLASSRVNLSTILVDPHPAVAPQSFTGQLKIAIQSVCMRVYSIYLFFCPSFECVVCMCCVCACVRARQYARMCVCVCVRIYVKLNH